MMHTPGPWIIKWTHRITTENDADGTGSIAHVYDCDEHDANALLIASAPDLLAALEGLLDKYVRLVESGDAGYWDCEKEEEVIKARAALAKAEGKPCA